MMMANAEEGSIGEMDEFFDVDDDGNDVYLDLDDFWREMGDPSPEAIQGSLDILSPMNIIEGLEDSKEVLSFRADVPNGVLSPSYNSEASDSRAGCSEGFSESAGNSVAAAGEMTGLSSLLCLTDHGYTRNVSDSVPPVHGNDLYNIYPDVGFSNSPSYYQNDKFSHPHHEEDLFGRSKADACSRNLCHKKLMEETDRRTSIERMEDSSVIVGDKIYMDASHTESSPYEVIAADIPHLLSENSGLFLFNSDNPLFFPHSSELRSLDSDYGRMFDTVDEGKNHAEELLMPYQHMVGSEFEQPGVKYENSSTFSFNGELGAFDMHRAQNESEKPSPSTLSNVYGKLHNDINARKKIESITSNDIVSRASEVIGDVISRKHYRGTGEPPDTKAMAWSLSDSLSKISHMNCIPHVKDDKQDAFFGSHRIISLGITGETPAKKSSIVPYDPCSVLRESRQPLILPSSAIKAELNCLKTEIEVPKSNGYSIPNKRYKGDQNNTFEHNSNDDDDDDLCVLEELSAPARLQPIVMNTKLIASSQFSTLRTPVGQMVNGHSRLKPNDESVIFRVALQDLSQPKSEATPPDGALAVPLLKHQRIALFWMVNKETKSACCSGGILADDQGLGKTVSTIALILKERSPSSKATKTMGEQIKTETLNLDEDDEASEILHVNEIVEPCQLNGFNFDGGNRCLQAKSRPAAGTLIVCPTSVLRQWSEELQTKVTREANLSVLVYHGSNRTKDPFELSKYDVVVTTYAIVSMEVPKQPFVDEKKDSVGTPSQGFPSCEKRKLLGTTPEKTLSKKKKGKKGIDNELSETNSGPLAKVGWFRVVLDEAQSIKNYRTQVARACWGLRAKRRWCLSGTPIQNAVDDLYSYFRFLRHEPYAVFRTFCEQIKGPIQRNPKNGFKKLQAVLKTIMLRRTKGTLLDGEPIINIPPKTIELRRVDFSSEEREFYRALEADSQAQFAEYAAKGTVRQNYVNILLMLLRLRQACDHPLLVKGRSCKSTMASSINMAKKLPRERKIFLLNCLEGAVCGICSDPPEDAAVTVCGHVFCNQCICERMLGDDSHCPAKNCKIHLTTSDVFSVTSLQNALSDQPSIENNIPNCAGSELADISESRSLTCPQDSSKIKAALEILLSLSKPHDSASRTSSSESKGETSDMRNPSVKVMGEKAIVFSQWTRMLDLLEASLKDCSIQYRRLDGTMHVTARDKAVKDFNSLPQVTVMIMSLKAASLGLNMVAACRVVLLDLWWNPTTEDQAIDRAHRIGQTRPVSVFRLTVKDTVEDRILALQQRKREMVSSAFGEDETGSRQTRLTVDDLKYLFQG